MTPQEQWEAWWAYHRANPDIWENFVRLTFIKIKQGHPRHSADSIMHAVRYEVDTDPVTSDKYKICNNYVAFYARLFADEFPDHAGFFRYRCSMADEFFGPL